MRAFITGITGFTGSHLAELLIAEGAEVAGIALDDRPPRGADLKGCRLHKGNLSAGDALERALMESAPDVVFHLAAFHVPSRASGDPEGVVEHTILATVRLYEAVKALPKRPAVFLSGSAVVYGRVPEANLPVKEDRPIDPLTAYGVGKAAQELYARQYRENYGVRMFLSRTFNSAGPRQSTEFFLSRLCHEIAKRERDDSDEAVEMWDLDVERDFLDVRDTVRAYRLLVAADKAEGIAVNVCLGKPVRLREVVELAGSLAKRKVQFVSRKADHPPSQGERIYGDPGILKKLTGFEPRFSLSDTLSDTLEYHRLMLSAG